MANRIQLVAGEEVFFLSHPPNKKIEKHKKKEPKKPIQIWGGVGSKRSRPRAFDYLDYAVMLSEPDRDRDTVMFEGSRETDRLNREQARQLKTFLAKQAKRDKETAREQAKNAKYMDTDDDDIMDERPPVEAEEGDPPGMDGLKFENEQDPVGTEDTVTHEDKPKRASTRRPKSAKPVDGPPPDPSDETEPKRPNTDPTVDKSSQAPRVSTDAGSQTEEKVDKRTQVDPHMQPMVDMVKQVNDLMSTIPTILDKATADTWKRDQQVKKFMDEVHTQRDTEFSFIQARQNDFMIDAMESVVDRLDKIHNSLLAGQVSNDQQSTERAVNQTEHIVNSIGSLQAQLANNATGMHASQQQQLEQMQQVLAQLMAAITNNQQPTFHNYVVNQQQINQLNQQQLNQQQNNLVSIMNGQPPMNNPPSTSSEPGATGSATLSIEHTGRIHNHDPTTRKRARADESGRALVRASPRVASRPWAEPIQGHD